MNKTDVCLSKQRKRKRQERSIWDYFVSRKRSKVTKPTRKRQERSIWDFFGTGPCKRPKIIRAKRKHKKKPNLLNGVKNILFQFWKLDSRQLEPEPNTEPEKELETDEPECVICLDSLLDMTRQCTLLECGHTYHRDCIKRWTMEKGCPICRCPTHVLL